MRYLLFLTLLLLVLSCSDFLTITPREEVSIEEQFSTLEGTKLALAGAYLKSEELLSSNQFLYADLNGGNITFTPIRTGTNKGIVNIPSEVELLYGFNEDPQNPSLRNFYQDSYTIITNLNNIIKYAPLLNADSTVVNQIRSEAYALRGFIHATLLKLYGQYYNYTPQATHLGIVYVDRILVGGVDYPARKTVKESYDLIIKDYNEALALASNSSALPGPAYSYLLPPSIHGLLARTYVEIGNYNKAIEHGLNAIQLSGAILTPSDKLISEWLHPDMPLSETILELTPPRDRSGTLVSSSVSAYYKLVLDPKGNVLDYAKYCASGDLLMTYTSEDIRSRLFFVQPLPVLTDTFASQNFYFTFKHQDNAGTPIMRLSELHLLLAEAYFKINDLDNALKYLNSIRVRAGLSSLTNPVNILEEIFIERRRELCFEGHLFFDISRFKKDCIRDIGCITTRCNLTHPNDRFVLPIPWASIIVNENIKQNEGY